MSRKNRNYSIEIKLKAVKMYLEEGLSSLKIAKLLDLSSKNRVLLWSKCYEEFGMEGLKERRGSVKSPLRGRPKKNFNSIEKEMEKLKAENEYLKKVVRIQKGVINVRDKFFIIRELSFKYTVKLLCDIAGVSRSGYYKWLNKGNIDISYSELENKILELY
ncbi:transposase, partial [Clostridium perfringens]|nr:transposase [Clostridium perfringens]